MAGGLQARGMFALFLKFWPNFFGVEAKNDEDALQARRHGLMKEEGGRKAIGPTDHAVRET